MIKIFKSNKIVPLFLFIMCVIIMFNPTIYAKSCLNAISVWAFKILPLMFPFFVFTRLIVNLSESKQNFMDKFFNKIYNTSYSGFSTFFLSTLSGYPMGAKLICNLYDNKKISQLDAEKMLSFCSVSGPMFIVGTVGVAMFNSFKIGIIILISNIVASLINGLFYRGKIIEQTNIIHTQKKQTISLSEIVYDSLISILMIGAYIMISFLIIDILNNLSIIPKFSKLICCAFNNSFDQQVVQSVLNGTVEMTRGILNLSETCASLQMKTIISSTLIGFGGISVALQSVNFLSRVKLSIKTMMKQKTTQALLCLLVSSLLSYLFL